MSRKKRKKKVILSIFSAIAVHKKKWTTWFFCLTFFYIVSLSVENPVTSHFSMAPTFQTMGCFLNKVASSSLVSAFLLLHGLGPTFSSPHSLTSHLLPRVMYCTHTHWQNAHLKSKCFCIALLLTADERLSDLLCNARIFRWGNLGRNWFLHMVKWFQFV